MIVETGQEVIFYASFENPDGEQAKLVDLPVVELLLGSESIFKSNMDRERNRFFLKKSLELQPGNYLAVYSAVDTDGVKLRGEESLAVIEKGTEAQKTDAKLRKFQKLYKGDCNRISERLQEISGDGVMLKRMVAKLLPTKAIEELRKEGK